MVKVFLDANVYFAASRSPQGGSSVIIKLIKAGKLSVFATPHVLREAEHNIRLKESLKTLLRFYELVESIKPKVIHINKKEAENRFIKVVNRKDTYVLEGVRKAKVKYLVTLDKKHLLSLKERIKWVAIVNPGELIEVLDS